MLRLSLTLLSLLLALPLRAEVAPTEVGSNLNNPARLGHATYRFVGLPLYEATLFTPGGEGFDWHKPAALQLVYARALSRGTIIKTTLSELKRMEGAQSDHEDLRRKVGICFRDVDQGDRFVAIATDAAEVSFWLNGEKTCDLRHAGARKRILGIWLSDDSRAVHLAQRLRGQ